MRIKAIARRSSYFILAFSIATVAHSARVTDSSLTARLLEVGIAQPIEIHRQADSATSATGFVSTGDIVFHGRTTTIPAKRGTTFGFSYMLEGLQTGRPLKIKQVIQHPPLRKPNGNVITEQVSYLDVVGSGIPSESKIWYFLREEYEVVPGVWNISLYNGTTLLLKQSFTLVRPR